MRTMKRAAVFAVLAALLVSALAVAAPAAAEPGQEKDSVAYKQAYALVLAEKWDAAQEGHGGGHPPVSPERLGR